MSSLVTISLLVLACSRPGSQAGDEAAGERPAPAASELLTQPGIPARAPARTAPEPEWEHRGFMQQPRERSRMVMLADERVLIVGGGSAREATAAAKTEIFDPATRATSTGPQLIVPRRDPEVVTLRDGRVMVIGGSSGSRRAGTRAVEVYSPSRPGTPASRGRRGEGKQGWIRVADMSTPRVGHAAVVLVDGRVLVTGGMLEPGVYLSSAELYDPATNRWTSAGSMSEVRAMHAAQLLTDGKVLVMGGGTDASATNGAELYDPEKAESEAGAWSPAPSMVEPRMGFGSVLLDDGRVMVAGGEVPAREQSSNRDSELLVLLPGVEIYDAGVRSWESVASMRLARAHAAGPIRLLDGRYLMAGGKSYPPPYHSAAATELWDPASDSWITGPTMSEGRSHLDGVRLRDGSVFVAGGTSAPDSPTVAHALVPLATWEMTRP